MTKRWPARCDIVLLVDEETGALTRDGRFRVEAGSVEARVLACLRGRRRVEVVAFERALAPTLERLRVLAPRLVFNLTEWVDGDRNLDAAVAGLLDMLQLPYTGTGPEGMRLARDKALAKTVVKALGVAVPRHFVASRRGGLRNPGVAYPLLVKPQHDDGSTGISAGSLVRSERGLRRRLQRARSLAGGPLLCEEFIPGRDLFVAVIGNAPRVLPAVEVVVGKKGAAAPKFVTYNVKHNPGYATRWRVRYRVPALADEVVAAIDTASRAIFHALKLRDYARIDYRLAPDGQLYFLEANPNPDLAPDAFGANRCFAGMAYRELIETIVSAARRRCGVRA